jgi:hypothetical protein
VTPEQEEQVRRALAGLGHEDPAGSPRMPPEVAARLDQVLRDLTASSTGSDQLSARRRRRWPHVLVAAAAAAVVVGGLVGVLRGATTSGSNAGSTSAHGPASSSVESAGAGRSTGSTRSSGPAGTGGSSAQGALAVPELHTATIDRDVRRVAQAPAAVVPRQRPLGARAPGSTGGTGGTGCPVPGAGPDDQLVAVRLDGRKAVLRLSPDRNGSRTARVYVCANPGHAVASTTVPAR